MRNRPASCCVASVGHREPVWAVDSRLKWHIAVRCGGENRWYDWRLTVAYDADKYC